MFRCPAAAAGQFAGSVLRVGLFFPEMAFGLAGHHSLQAVSGLAHGLLPELFRWRHWQTLALIVVGQISEVHLEIVRLRISRQTRFQFRLIHSDRGQFHATVRHCTQEPVVLGIGQKSFPVCCLHLLHDCPQLAFLPLCQRKVRHDSCNVKYFVIKFLVFIRFKHSLQRKMGAAYMTAPISFDLILPVIRPTLFDPVIKAQGLCQHDGDLMDRSPILSIVQTNRRLEQPPD